MEWYYILLIILASLIVFIFLSTFICYYITFFNKPIKTKEEFYLPNMPLYKKYKDDIIEGIKLYRNTPSQDFEITSKDGLKLHGKYFEFDKNYPIEILFHGYRGTGERDVGNGIERCKAVKHNALIVDQRTAGKSQGHTISFGINERYDAIAWINFVIKHFGEDVEIYLGGVSMGAATVCLVSDMNLPSNVKGILADCGYDNAKDIIKLFIKELKLPANILYPFVKLAAYIYGHFKLEESSPLKAVSHTNIPIIFIHGNIDKQVPFEMSEKLYNACSSSKKKLVKFENAEHGVSFIIDKEKYINEVNDFFNNN